MLGRLGASRAASPTTGPFSSSPQLNERRAPSDMMTFVGADAAAPGAHLQLEK